MINLSNVVPSNVGDYAACTQRLVYDSIFGRPYTSNCYADYGTVCHYWTQLLLGCPPSKSPTEEQYELARTVPELKHKSMEELIIAAKKCGEKAIKSLPTLPAGITWLSENKAYDKTILPARKGRHGDICGFGGDVDLLRSDRTELWDLKFIGRPVDVVKPLYMWQLGSYFIVSKVPTTGILFVTRDAKWSGQLKINWTSPPFDELADKINGFLFLVGQADFERLAYPMEGPHCEWCPHKGRCPTKHMPAITTKYESEVSEQAKQTLENFLAPGRLNMETNLNANTDSGVKLNGL